MRKRGEVKMERGVYQFKGAHLKGCDKVVMLRRDGVFYGCEVGASGIRSKDTGLNGKVEVWY